MKQMMRYKIVFKDLLDYNEEMEKFPNEPKPESLSEKQREILEATGLESLKDLQETLEDINENLKNVSSEAERQEILEQKKYFTELQKQLLE